MNKKALILTWTGVSDEELIYSYYRLKEEGFDVAVLSNVFSTDDNPKPLKGVNGCSFESYSLTSLVDTWLIDDFDLLILPGGVKSLERLRQEQRVIDFIKEWNKKGKVIGSICWAAQLLISAKCVKNRRISGYYSLKDDIENAGAIYVDEPAVIDNNIISTAHYKHLGPWMKAVLQVYYEKNNKQ